MQLARFTANFTDSCRKEFKAKSRDPSDQGKTVLLIDDQEMVINISEMMLKKLGYEVLKAHNGHEGIQRFEANKDRIDLIISDLEMPFKHLILGFFFDYLTRIEGFKKEV